MKTLFTVSLIVELLFALGFIAVPVPLLNSFGVDLDLFGTALARIFGSALLAFVTLLWYARSSDSPELHKATLRGMFVYWLLSSILLVLAQLGGLLNSMGWSAILIQVGFLLWYAVYAFRK